jgi:anthranilate synthase component 1
LGLPDAVFLDVDTVLIFDHVRRKIRIVSHAWPSGLIEQSYSCAVDRIDEIAECLERPVDAPPLPAPVVLQPVSNLEPSEFEDMVTAGKKHIRAGDILQVVLSQRLSMPLDGDPFGLYRRLRTVSPSPYMYYLDLGDHQLVGASPELLIQVERGIVTSRPIAGTRRRGKNREEDIALAKDLVEDEKERAEHLMLVDLARNDVGRVSAPGTVEVSNFMGVEQFSHVMHMVSDVTGRLRKSFSPYDALRAAFPAGTVSGAPKIRAMRIISELERDRRGSYAGAAGFISKGGNMETAITIRTGVIKDGVLHVQAGAGIVADSVPEREYVESMNKARAMLEAAGGAS